MPTPIIQPQKSWPSSTMALFENYNSLKQDLLRKSHRFESETDTEVFIHFIEDIKNNENCSWMKRFASR